MTDELDLEDERPARRRGRPPRPREADKEQPDVTEPPGDDEIRTELKRAFGNLADSRYAKGDTELGDAFKEEGDAMSEGLTQLTRAAAFLRNPIVIAINITIIFLAFGRVGGILFERVQRWRFARANEEEVEVTYEGADGAVPIEQVQ